MYRKAFRFFFVPLPLLVLARAALKLLFIDPDTGFYQGAPLLPWLFGGVTALAVLLTVFGAASERDAGMRVLRGTCVLEAIGFLLGLALIAVSVMMLIRLPGETRIYNVLPRWMRAAEYILGILTGLALMLFAALSGDAGRALHKGSLALLICLWQALYLLERFVSFRQVGTASDQMLETLFWTATLVFWTNHARCIAGEGASRRRTVALALAAALFGVPCAVGQLAAAFLAHAQGDGVILSAALMLAVALYEIVFAVVCAHSPSEGDRY